MSRRKRTQSASEKSSPTISCSTAKMQAHSALGVFCPACNSNEIGIHARIPKLRYICKGCDKTFVYTYGTPQHWLKKPKIYELFVNQYFDLTVAEGAKKVMVSQYTLHHWRLKTLYSLEAQSKSQVLNGVVDAGQMKMELNQKGSEPRIPEGCQSLSEAPPVACFVVYERISGKISMHVSGIEQTSENFMETWKEKASKVYAMVNQQTDKWNEENCKLAQKRSRPEYDFIATIINDFRHWMKRFYGVASKNLQLYMRWYCCRVQLEKHQNQNMKFTQLLMQTFKGYFRHSENNMGWDEFYFNT